MAQIPLLIGASEDDAVEDSGGSVDLTAIYLQLGADTWAGLRFEHVLVPPGAKIVAADLNVYVQDASKDDFYMDIYGQAADSPNTFTAASNDISGRPRTTAKVTVEQGSVGAGWYTVNVSAIIQEIVNRPGWAGGNALAFLWVSLPGATLFLEAYDDDPAFAAELIIDYIVVGEPVNIRALVADRRGRLIGELHLDIESVLWQLNDVGEVVAAISKADPKAIEYYLRFGNRLLLEFGNGLPHWGGVIDFPREWTESEIGLSVYSGENILGNRKTPKNLQFETVSGGYLFQQLLTNANAGFDTGITLGEVWVGGDAFSIDFHFANLLSVIRDELCPQSGGDFDVTPVLEDGRITFVANFRERRGRTKPGVALIEGHNAINVKLVEQGPIANDWDVVGGGATWDDERPSINRRNGASIDLYDLRQDTLVLSDTDDEPTLTARADDQLEEYGQPHNMLELEALNLEPALFSSYDIGDSIRVILFSYGFNGFNRMVRLLGRRFNRDSGTCTLIVREETTT